jgi:hypothetical protein
VAEIEAVVDAYCEDNLVTFGSAVPQKSIDPDPTTGALFGDDLTVDVRFQYDFLILPGFINSLFGGIELSAHTTMKYE